MQAKKRSGLYRAFRKRKSSGRTAGAILASAAALTCADHAWAVDPNPLQNAYWRFEEGTANTPVTAATDTVVDSANGNNMRTASASSAPTYSGIVSTPIIPQTGLTNALSLQFNNSSAGEDIFSNNQQINNPVISNGFTLEASFKLGNVGGGAYQCIVGKDGMPTSSMLAPLEFKVRGDSAKLQIEILDGSGADKQVSSLAAVSANHWYHVAAVDTGSSLSLYIDSGNGAGYQLQGSTPISGALDVAGGNTPWSIGRGFFNNVPADWINNGQVEEVRLSNTALSQSSFLFTPATGRWNVDADGVWSAPGSWQNGIPRVAGATANLSDAISTGGTITVDVPVTVGTLNFNNAHGYLVNGSQTIDIDMGSNTPGAINVTSGSHVVSAPMAFARDTTVTVTNAPDTLKLTGSLSASTVTLTKEGSGTLEVPNFTATGVNVNSGKLRIAASGGTGVSQIGQIAISDPGALDLVDNKLITSTWIGDWTGFAYEGMLGMIQSGRNGGAWNGSGIVTSQSAALGDGPLTTLAVAQASDIGKSSLGNVAVGPNDVLVMYTYTGDADLSGGIDGDDYARIDTGFANQLFGYNNGDFNYDGVINADDYFIIDRNYARQGAPFSAGDTLSSVAAVPEPGMVGIVMISLAMTKLRRRKSQE